MKKPSFLVFGLFAYWSFVLAILYLVGFTGDIIVPRAVDTGPEASIWLAATIDIGLIVLFGVQHSLMARRGFKKWLEKHVPGPLIRSTYVLATTSVLGLMFWFWRPIPVTIWRVENGSVGLALYGIFFAGWAVALIGSFQISHFGLFGLKQAWCAYKGQEYESPDFQISGLYKHVRHPINLGFLIAIWSTPHMTAGHLLFSLAMTGYILIGTVFEERDLAGKHGDDYLKYKKSVPMLIPYALYVKSALGRFVRR